MKAVYYGPSLVQRPSICLICYNRQRVWTVRVPTEKGSRSMPMMVTTVHGQKEYRGKGFPLVLRPEVPSDFKRQELLDWVAQHRDKLRARLCEHGAVLLRDCPIDGPHDFEAVLAAADFVNMPDVVSSSASGVTKGRILTANESPADQPIPFHHEMAQIAESSCLYFLLLRHRARDW